MTTNGNWGEMRCPQAREAVGIAVRVMREAKKNLTEDASGFWDTAPGGDAVGAWGEEKTPTEDGEGFWDKAPGGDLLLHGRTTLPSAQLRFTSEFGMGSGGTTAL